MIKTSDPVIKDGLGIMARLVIIAMLLGVLGTLLQGCEGTTVQASVEKEIQSVSVAGIYEYMEIENSSSLYNSAEILQPPF